MISPQQVERSRRHRASKAATLPRRAYSFARAGELWMPKGKRLEAAPFTLAFTPTMMGFSNDDTPLDWPAASSLLSWHHWALNRTYSSQLASEGTSPPALTFSGTVPIALGLEVRIASGAGGARGTAQFEWRPNQSASWSAPITTAIDNDLGNGVHLHWSVGTYATDNVYYLKISEWRDQTGNNHHFVTTDASLAKYPVPMVTGAGTALGFDGVNDILQCTTLGSPLCGGSDNDFHLFMVAQILDLTPSSGQGTLLFCGDGSTNRATYFLWNNTPNFRVHKNDVSGVGTVNVTGGTPNTSLCLLEVRHTGTTAEIRRNKTTLVGPTAQNVDSVALTVATIGSSMIGGAEGNPGEVNLYEMLTYDRDLTDDEANDIATRLGAPYGL